MVGRLAWPRKMLGPPAQCPLAIWHWQGGVRGCGAHCNHTRAKATSSVTERHGSGGASAGAESAFCALKLFFCARACARFKYRSGNANYQRAKAKAYISEKGPAFCFLNYYRCETGVRVAGRPYDLRALALARGREKMCSNTKTAWFCTKENTQLRTNQQRHRQAGACGRGRRAPHERTAGHKAARRSHQTPGRSSGTRGANSQQPVSWSWSQCEAFVVSFAECDMDARHTPRATTRRDRQIALNQPTPTTTSRRPLYLSPAVYGRFSTKNSVHR